MRENPNLVVNGRFQAWWPLKCSMLGGQWGSILLGGQWEVLSLVVNGEASCLVANERFQCLVAIRRFQAWWPLEGSKLSGPWEEEKKHPFHLFPFFHFIRFYLNLFFIDLKFLLYHGSRPLFCFFPSFSLTYKLQSCISKYQVFYTFIIKSILIEDFSFH